MKAIIPNLSKDKGTPLYLQLYDYLKAGILLGELKSDEKLPSIRKLADDLVVSVTTINMAYQQLLVEGYIKSKPQSGYFINQINALPTYLNPSDTKPQVRNPGEPEPQSINSHNINIHESESQPINSHNLNIHESESQPMNNNSSNTHGSGSNNLNPQNYEPHDSNTYISNSPNTKYIPPDIEKIMEKNSDALFFDVKAFDFVKWKKCMTKILNEHSHLLLHDGDPQGEDALRFEITRYLYQSRGVNTKPENIVIGAGMQQITRQLSSLLLMDGISNLVVEAPGYSPVHNIFKEYGFDIMPVTVESNGISFEKIPARMRCAIYTSPSNQFPTGAVMPVGKRYDFLELAGKNNSYIIEDDYDSELRYFGKPIPPLQSLDENDRVVYLGSFSSTLFPSIKISYMVLPQRLAVLYKGKKHQYTQTCSKTEQLTLAYYMSKGYYQTNIKKLRRLYAQKLQLTISAFKKYAPDFVNLLHSSSGISMLIEVRTKKNVRQIMTIAENIGVLLEEVSFAQTTTETTHEVSGNNERKRLSNKESFKGGTDYPVLVLHFHQIPMGKIDAVVKEIVEDWRY